MSRKKKNEEGADPNAWLATYSDTITLLLTFFVLLYSFSTVDVDKFKAIASAFQSVLQGSPAKSVVELNNGKAPIVGMPVPTTTMQGDSNAEDMYDNMKELIKQNDLEELIDIKKDSRGYIFELKDKILFESGRAELKKESKPILDIISQYIKTINNDIIVEGHTDNVPIHNSKYYDNWDLSSARANTVARYFIHEKDIMPHRLFTMGFGEYHPLVENDTALHRATNRRVNIIIVTDKNEEDGEN